MRRKHGYTHAFIDCDSLVNKYLPEKIMLARKTPREREGKEKIGWNCVKKTKEKEWDSLYIYEPVIFTLMLMIMIISSSLAPPPPHLPPLLPDERTCNNGVLRWSLCRCIHCVLLCLEGTASVLSAILTILSSVFKCF